MTPAEAAVAAITAPVDAALAKVVASVTRLEAQKVTREDGLLREVAARIEFDMAFKYAVIALAID